MIKLKFCDSMGGFEYFGHSNVTSANNDSLSQIKAPNFSQ